jgi:hypothetical protein
VGAVTITVGTFSLLYDKIAGASTELITWITALTLLALPVALLANLLRARGWRAPRSVACSSTCATTATPRTCATLSPARSVTLRCGSRSG